MDLLQRTILMCFTEDVSHPAPVSCKGTSWGRPLVWNDRKNKCVGVSAHLQSSMASAQKISASAIGRSQHARAFKEGHKEAAKEHEKAVEAHREASEHARKEGFYHVGAALARQAGHHAKLVTLHQDAHVKNEKEANDKTAKAPEDPKTKEKKATTSNNGG